MKRLIRKPPEQTPFIIILAAQGRRYRNVILAYDVEEAREKAVQMTTTLTGNFEVQAVRHSEPSAADAARGREAVRAAQAPVAEQARDGGIASATSVLGCEPHLHHVQRIG